MTPEEKIFEEVWYDKMVQANNCVYINFVFFYDEVSYLCKWEKGKWQDPIKINIL